VFNSVADNVSTTFSEGNVGFVKLIVLKGAFTALISAVSIFTPTSFVVGIVTLEAVFEFLLVLQLHNVRIVKLIAVIVFNFILLNLILFMWFLFHKKHASL
jgi:hypothetical protein